MFFLCAAIVVSWIILVRSTLSEFSMVRSTLSEFSTGLLRKFFSYLPALKRCTPRSLKSFKYILIVDKHIANNQIKNSKCISSSSESIFMESSDFLVIDLCSRLSFSKKIIRTFILRKIIIILSVFFVRCNCGFLNYLGAKHSLWNLLGLTT